jgi:hypothetical protein
MNCDAFFATALRCLRGEQRYRVFVVKRIAGRFQRAFWHSPTGEREPVIWCSNDSLHGPTPESRRDDGCGAVLLRRGRRRHAQYSRNE